MSGICLDDIDGAYVRNDGTDMRAVAMYRNGARIWPPYAYVITSASVVYSVSPMRGSVPYITANGDNYATVIGTVEKRLDNAVIETYANQVLVPTVSSASFFLSGNEIHAYNLTNNPTAQNDLTIGCRWVSGGDYPFESEPYQVVITQQGNQPSSVDYIDAIGLGTDLGVSGRFGISGGQCTLSATKSYHTVTTWTSGYSSTQYGRTLNISESTIFTITQPSTSGASISGRTMSAQSRVENDVEGTWTVQGAYVLGGTTHTHTIVIKQTPDTCVDTISDINYWVSIGVGTSTISAAGGTATLNWGGGHTRRVHRIWGTGGVYNYDSTVSDTPAISGSASYFTRSGATVTHDNMGTRWNYNLGYGYDSVTYTATNNGVTDTVTIEAFNYRTRLDDVTTGFHINNPSKVTSIGATITIQGTRTYKTDRYRFTSGSVIDGTPTSAIADASSVTISSQPSWIPSVSGANVMVSYNAAGDPERSASFSATYTDPVSHENFTDDSGTLTQWAGTTTSTEIQCTALTVYPVSVSASSYGQSHKAAITHQFQQRVNTTTDGVTTVGEWEAMEGRNAAIHIDDNNFTLYNATTGDTGQGVSVGCNDLVYIYPNSANAEPTSRNVTISEGTGIRTCDFEQEAQSVIVKPTCHISMTADEGSEEFSFTINATYNVATQVAVTYSYGYVDFRGRTQSVDNAVIWIEAGNNSVTTTSTIGSLISATLKSVSPAEDSTYFYVKSN